ncbi:MAG: phosphomannomutase [Gallionellaceae bacterium]|nr:phosphomannomutase [Gallionellaceae bacterium]
MTLPEKSISIDDLMSSSCVRFGTSGVRGLVSNMTNEVCFAYTLAFLRLISAVPGSRVAIGMDLRPSSIDIAGACAAAIRYAGSKADFCGEVPTPALALYAQEHGIPALMVTGSHIPFDRNGIKFYGPMGEITKTDEISISGAVVTLPERCQAINLPEINPVARQMYIGRYIRFFPSNCLAGMKLGFYEHSSVARDLLREILQSLGAEVISLGRTNEFVPIDTEAVSDADIQQARRWAAEHGFDALLSTDGDADRPLIGDEHGHWLRGDIVGTLCAQHLGAQAVATTVSCNTAIEKCGAFAKVVRARIGSPYVIGEMKCMLESGLQNVAGFEPNGGFLVGSSLEKYGRTLTPLLTRDAVIPILSILAMTREKGCSLSQLSHDLPARFTASDRLKDFPTETSQQILLSLAASEAAIADLLGSLCGHTVGMDQTDGLRIHFDNDEIVHFRPSGNAPELRCYTEAATRERADLLAHECLGVIREAFQSSDA